MVRKRFQDRFDKLSAASNLSDDIDKDDPWRDDGVTSAGQDITSLYDPAVPRQAAPSVVEPPESVRANKTGKIAAIITIVVLLVGVAALAVTVVSIRNSVPIEIESVVESVDAANGCEWHLEIELRNRSEEPVTVERMAAILNRGRRTGTLERAPLLAPGQTGTHLVRFRLHVGDVCPAVDEINHGDLIFHLADGSTQSLRP